MSLPPDIFAGLKRVVGDWPELGANSLPEHERRAGNDVQQTLRALSSYASDFGAAVRLFDESFNEYARATITNTTSDGLARMHIAARDGAVTIWNFAKALESTARPIFTECPTLAQYVDRKQLKAANKLLRQLFPDFAEIRHSVGHAQELREEATKHQVDGTVGEMFPTLHAHPLATVQTKILIRNSLHGRTFRNTFEGRLRTYEVSSDSVAGLNRIKDAAYAAFANCPSVHQA
ncbi:hypothetical protein [Bradyrhizobium sp. C9]|uniref:hypothetical protein n=1 Tax=Bradyrhizobium sp. C9 TaxID=142585 RepID=UPI000BE939AF|nr:hypothetical protein [Bradyrhizobium sp. C9]PDT76991.1 hypothetical protein CO675_10420 [Bradyrhizobium sp. C9]